MLTRLYQIVHGFYGLWLYLREYPDLELLSSRLAGLREAVFLSQIKRLGASCQAALPKLAHLALHDARQGGLPALIELSAQADLDYEQLQRCALLARDHAKMMRNAFHDLDLELGEADSSPKAHAFASVLTKMEQIFQIPTRSSVSGSTT